jgi:hypothetical protein
LYESGFSGFSGFSLFLAKNFSLTSYCFIVDAQEAGNMLN